MLVLLVFFLDCLYFIKIKKYIENEGGYYEMVLYFNCFFEG